MLVKCVQFRVIENGVRFFSIAEEVKTRIGLLPIFSGTNPNGFLGYFVFKHVSQISEV